MRFVKPVLQAVFVISMASGCGSDSKPTVAPQAANSSDKAGNNKDAKLKGGKPYQAPGAAPKE
ncbi:hypothetical protein FTUN_7806 [Frigoriglobus tundricola]|uniref:Uncharacterized protein n=1 Tax=Frigoriglobus tundricola TaxID=2774151 RepID=A0A6M5Z404_9BACT|nr:hypothetical protein FTUN_7806 [Frigoriglobus tundricola]